MSRIIWQLDRLSGYPYQVAQRDGPVFYQLASILSPNNSIARHVDVIRAIRREQKKINHIIQALKNGSRDH